MINRLKKHLVYIVLGIIIIMAAFIRLYQIDKIPISPDWDEAALGYNAYSIIHTGKDEYGKFFPIVLQSFDDYKPALYAYLIIPFIKLFDLSVVAVRLPSAIFGTVTIGVVFFIILELFKKEFRMGRITIKPYYLALLTSFLLAISPWHIQFSRVAFEAQIGLTLNLLALIFFLKAFKNNFFLPISFSLAAVNMYVYQSEKVYTPLLFIILIVIFWKQFIKIQRKWLIGSFLLAFFIVLPMAVYILTTPNSLSRAKGVSVFSDSEKLLSENRDKNNRNRANGDLLGLMLDNRRVDYARAFVSGYLSHFQLNWLFYSGDVARHHSPYMGLLYLWSLPFILIGIYVLLFSDITKQTKWFLIMFLLIAPIPASVTTDVPHAVRTINFIPIFDIFTSIGFLYVVSKVYALDYSIFRFRIKYLIFAIGGILILLNISYFFDQYFVQQNYFYSKYWQYGWKEAVNFTVNEGRRFDKIVVTNVSPLDQSYIFFLFYTKYDPKKYLQEGGTKSGSFDDEHTAFGKYIFRPINWEKDQFEKNTLFLGRPEEIPVNFAFILRYLNGEEAIRATRKFE